MTDKREAYAELARLQYDFAEAYKRAVNYASEQGLSFSVSAEDLYRLAGTNEIRGWQSSSYNC